jgi:hypothetical protein
MFPSFARHGDEGHVTKRAHQHNRERHNNFTEVQSPGEEVKPLLLPSLDCTVKAHKVQNGLLQGASLKKLSPDLDVKLGIPTPSMEQVRSFL